MEDYMNKTKAGIMRRHAIICLFEKGYRQKEIASVLYVSQPYVSKAIAKWRSENENIK
jgi:predicted transcriptional regulator